MNKVTLIGRLVDKVESHEVKDDLVVANFTVAVNTFNKEVANFFKCVAFDKVADVLDEYSYKGMQVAVSGSLQNRDYEDKDGVKHYVTEILVRDVEFLGSRPQEEKEEKPVKKTGSYRTRK